MKLKLQFITAVLAIVYTTNAQEVQSSKFGKGIFNLTGNDSTWTMKIGARVQLLATSNWEEGTSNQTNFSIRRARLKFDGYALTPKLKYKIELGLSNRDLSGASEYTSNAPRYILDAVIKWNFHQNFVLWFGQTKLPGNRERVISSANMQMVDRSMLNSYFNIDRDIGFQLHHHFNISENFIVKEIVSFSQGEGRNITTGNLGGHQYTARLEVLPFGYFTDNGDYKGADLKRESTPKLALGITYDYNDNAVKTRSNQGSYMVTDNGFFEADITTLFIDAMFKYKGFSFMTEYADRNSNKIFATNLDGTFTGDVVQVGQSLNFQTGYLLKKNWEISARYTTVNWDEIINRNNRHQYTLGLSKYIVGHKLKVQTDISHLEIKNSNNEFLYRLQFDIHF